MSKTKKVLIVDDEPSNMEPLREALEALAYQVLTADCGRIALEIAHREVPDLILLDVVMPEMDGYEVCEALKGSKGTCDIPIVFVSGTSEQFNKHKAFQAGGVDFINKPVDPEELRLRTGVHVKLRQKVRQLEDFNKVMIDREMRLIELKQEVNALAQELGRKFPYPEVWADES